MPLSVQFWCNYVAFSPRIQNSSDKWDHVIIEEPRTETGVLVGSGLQFILTIVIQNMVVALTVSLWTSFGAGCSTI